jgi:hypothetical protein
MSVAKHQISELVDDIVGSADGYSAHTKNAIPRPWLTYLPILQNWRGLSLTAGRAPEQGIYMPSKK